MEAPTFDDSDLQREALASELSNNTRVAYQKGWDRFVEYCAEEQIADPLSVPPEEVARFLVHLATRPSPHSGIVLSMGTVTLYKSAVNKKYIGAGKQSPTSHPVVQATLKGLARLKGSASRQVEALREYHIEAMLKACPDSIIGRRDAAIIAVGFAGALRRSEICSLSVADVEFIDAGEYNEERMFLTIRQSKTDQQGKGQRIAILDGRTIRPRPASSIMAQPLWHSGRRSFPDNEERWALTREAAAPQRCPEDHQTLCCENWTRPEGHSWTFASSWFRYERSCSSCEARQDYGCNPTHESRNSDAVHTRCRRIRGPRRTELPVSRCLHRWLIPKLSIIGN